ncbi:ABC transporter ATP-binding protein [Acidiferrimicrobium sp. IK]|uniref:ABC transporter ATP-binding protein n=1 Tax=Acidiferrimicrobium sp. IK TaxID=2871700 RepID=UPI0039670FC4
MLLRLLTTHLRRYRGLLAAAVALQFVQTMATLFLPTLNADIIDKGVLTKNTGYIWRLGGVMLVVAAGQVAFSIAATYFGAKAAMGFGRDVRGGLFHRVTGFSAREVGQFGAPSLITRITNDVQQVQILVVMTLTLFVAAPIMLVGGIVMAVREDGPLSVVLVVSIPAMLVGLGMVVVRMVPQFQAMQIRLDRVNQVLREQITGIRVVRAFVREPEEGERFAVANDELTANSLRAGRLMAFMFPIVMLVLNGSSAAVLWLGADRIGAGRMQIGALIAFLSYLVQILMSVMMATFVAMMWPRAAVCAERIQDVLSTASSVVAPAVPVTALRLRGTLELQGVGFHYPRAEAPVLSDISLRALPGQTTAIIGSTGAGKTTLLSLVPRLFDVTSGKVLVDGADVRDIEPQLLWSRIGLVPQKPYLFSGTVASNLRYADPDASDTDLWAALEVAQARDFVAAMPGGLEAPIAQGGSNVSGGQRQRLAIARALVRKPEIFLFDDSFSALDLATDARLRAALAPVTAAATVLIVAQRVSTIAGADQILVLEDGRAVGLGTHRQLIASCPTYAEIVASQVTAEEAA